ncbi:MAG: tetratricopeptide repeat protein [Planctomycetaceae bacterium]|jgi:tetratricopeptide (TPR) repeat protein|nr:tetratricopeptide repeat protein [Planctomycetaceae bacterium]
MAKRYNEEEKDEDDEIVIRRRRRPIKKPVTGEDDDEADAGRNPKKRTAQEQDNDDYDDEEEDYLLPSTGIVLLDIALDYWDDYVYWTKDHFIPGLIIGILGFLAFFIPTSLLTLYIYNYVNRPTLQKAIDAYDFGAYGEAGKFAETVLKYTSRRDDLTRAGALFVLGASSCSIAEMNSGNPKDLSRKNYYLAAAKYLSDCRSLGYYPGRKAEAAFMLGKSFYLAGEFVKAREPLIVALENNSPNKKMLYWYLSNAYLLSPEANTTEADKFIKLFQAEPTVTDNEIFESDLFNSMIQIYNNNPDNAEKILRKVPQFDQYATMKTFIKGQIAFLRANIFRKKSLTPDSQQNSNDINILNNNVPFTDIPIPPIPEVNDNPNNPNNNLPPDNNNSRNNSRNESAKPQNYYLNAYKKFPSGVVAVSTISDSDDNKSIYQRINYLAQIESIEPPPSAARTMPSSESETESETGTESNTGTETDESPTAVLPPDAVITLPPEPATGSGLPDSEPGLFPTEILPDGGFFPPSEINPGLITTDPFSSDSKKFKELAQQKYQEAIELFREVRHNDLFDQKWLRTAELLEAKCNEEIGMLDEAKIRYANISEIFADTDEAAAADFFYAELERDAGRFKDVITIYDRSFATLRKNLDYACHWLTRKEINKKTHEILQWLMRKRDYRSGIVFLSITQDIITQPDIAKFRGEFYENWGKELYQQSLKQKEPQRNGGEHESGYIEKFRRAGEAFGELARYQFGEKTYDQQIWRSAENYRLGKDNKRGIESYKVYLRVNKVDRQPESLLYIGEMYLNLAMIDNAIANLEDAIAQYPRDALISRIKLTLSYAYIEKRETDKAKQLLISNLIAGSYDPSSLVYSDSVYLLAKLSYEQGNTADAIVYLEDALKTHPNAPQAAEAHYFVSRSYLARAESTLAMIKDSAQVKEVLDQIQDSVLNDRILALEHIQTAERLLTRRRDTKDLSESESIMLRNTMFGAGKIMILLKQYEKAIATFNMVATRYQEPASLDALLQIAIAYRLLKRTNDAVAALNSAEMLLQRFEDSGTIPKGSNWAEKIQVQKNIINNGVENNSN